MHSTILKRSAASIALLALLALQVMAPFPLVAHADEDASSTPIAALADEPSAATSSPDDSVADLVSTTTTPDLLATTTPDAASSTVDALPLATTTPDTASSTAEAVSTATTTLESFSADTGSSVPAPEDASTTASSTGPVIESGSAVALANILNLVNTTFVNSNGSFQFANFTDPVTDALDLRDAASPGTCSQIPCVGGTGVTVAVANDAVIDNALLIQATSGGNAIGADASSSAAIRTGDAYAGLNLINLANTTFVNSNYLLAAINAFGGVTGDIVLPSLANFFTGAGDAPGTIDTATAATVENDLSTTADSGSNATTNVGTSTIASGSAYSFTNIFNQLNTVLSGSAATILLRVSGDWSGKVYGAPSGYSFVPGPGGLYLFAATPGTGNGGMDNASTLTASSTASITNSAGVAASTGQNAVDGAGAAAITTGNAYAGANVVNVANDTIVGNNWLLAVINVFGDFTGDIDFGRPDLWIGDQIVDAPNPVEPGSVLTYKFSVINNGDADAVGTTLTDTHDASQLAVLSSSAPYATSTDGTLSWDLGTIPAGKAVEVSYTATVTADNDAQIATVTTVGGEETDNNPSDNTDSVSITVGAPAVYGAVQTYVAPSLSSAAVTPLAASSTAQSALANISVVRTPAEIDLTGTTTTHESLVLRNESANAATNVTLYDVVTTPGGDTLDGEPWDVGTIGANEEVDIDYDLDFGAGAVSGEYVVTPELTGDNVSVDPSSDGLGAVTLMAAPLAPLALSHILGASTLLGSTDEAPLKPAPQGSTALDEVFGPQVALAAGADYAPGSTSYGLIDALALAALSLIYFVWRRYMRRKR